MWNQMTALMRLDINKHMCMCPLDSAVSLAALYQTHKLAIGF